jgi:ADP-ribose pyrophosphatase YjhB (NUDIX family)
MIKCILENGRETSFRHVVADVIVTNGQNEILLVKRAVNLVNGGKYAIPGGFVDRDETIIDAGIREVLEETGYAAESLLLFRIIDNPNRPQEDRQNIAFLYIAKVKGGEKALNNEVSEIKWFNLSQLPDKDQFAFDHYENIQLYIKYLKEKFAIPIIGKI